MSRPSFPLRAVAALFIERQHLDRPRGRRLTRAALTAFAENVGGIQLDSINVIDRAHAITLWSRFGPYDRATLDRLVYRDRLLFEYWAHAACLVAASHFPWWRRVMADYRIRHTGWSAWLKKNGKMLGAVEDAIRAQGPLGNADFKHPRRGTGTGWWSWKPAAHALHYLWMTGRLHVHSRLHFQKRLDLAERVMPGPHAPEPPSAEEFLHWHLRRSFLAMGAATELDLARYLTFPRIPPQARRQALDRMLASGEVVEIEVAGAGDARGRRGAASAGGSTGIAGARTRTRVGAAIVGDTVARANTAKARPSPRGRWLALAEDLPALAAAGRRQTSPRGTTLLTPFDSFLWHRERTLRLFGFDYRIEVYTPSHRRVYGYYVLPILHDGRIIGRLDAKNHRSTRVLEVRRVHFEPWFVAGGASPAASWGTLDRARTFAGVAEAIHSLAVFLGAPAVRLGPVEPRALRGPLGEALGLSGARAKPRPFAAARRAAVAGDGI